MAGPHRLRVNPRGLFVLFFVVLSSMSLKISHFFFHLCVHLELCGVFFPFLIYILFFDCVFLFLILSCCFFGLLKDAGLGRKWFTGTSAPSHPSENGSPEPPDGFPATENGSPEPPAAWHLCNLNLLLCTEICVVLCFLLLICFGCVFIMLL